MVKRRDVLGGGILGGLLGGLGEGAGEAGELEAQRQQPLENFGEVVSAIANLQKEIANGRTFHELAAVRDAQRQFLRVNQHLPNFIDVGAGHWFNVYDWHVRWQQALNLGRDALGRYTIAYLGTTIVLRPEMPDGYMSAPYDER